MSVLPWLLALPFAANAAMRLATLEFPEMKGWVRRTHNIGVVQIVKEHLEVGPDKPGENSIFQIDIKLADTGVARVAINARWRVEGVVGGEQSC